MIVTIACPGPSLRYWLDAGLKRVDIAVNYAAYDVECDWLCHLDSAMVDAYGENEKPYSPKVGVIVSSHTYAARATTPLPPCYPPLTLDRLCVVDMSVQAGYSINYSLIAAIRHLAGGMGYAPTEIRIYGADLKTGKYYNGRNRCQKDDAANEHACIQIFAAERRNLARCFLDMRRRGIRCRRMRPGSEP